MKKLSDDKIAELYRTFCFKQSNAYVARKCQVNPLTVKRYRKLDKWDERVAKIQKTVAIRVDKKQENHKVQHAKVGREMWEKGQNRIASATDKDIDVRLAKDMVKDGVAIEREALGDHAPNVVIKLELPEGLRI